MTRSARLYLCALCRRQVSICSHCDHGNIYCGKPCSDTARDERQKLSARRYQRSRKGRLSNANRQRRFREKQQREKKGVARRFAQHPVLGALGLPGTVGSKEAACEPPEKSLRPRLENNRAEEPTVPRTDSIGAVNQQDNEQCPKKVTHQGSKGTSFSALLRDVPDQKKTQLKFFSETGDKAIRCDFCCIIVATFLRREKIRPRCRSR